jgi:protoporphyrinogen oxidase
VKDIKTVIIGAGLAGLSCGYELTKNGFSATIYESNENVGGLAKTLWFKTSQGEFGFDFGGHRFLSRDEPIQNFFFDVVGPENIEKRLRSSRILLKGKFFDYPIKPFSALFKMPIWLTIKAGVTYWYAYFRYFLARRRGEDNFEDWVKHRFGSTLYNLFFRDYTQKTWGISPTKISSTWAAERIKTSSLISMIKNSISRPDPESKISMTLYKQFLYPSNGIQVLSNNMAKFIENKGNKIVKNSKLTKITLENDMITQIVFNNKIVVGKIDTLVSSIPLPSLIESFGNLVPKNVQEAANNLKYRDLIVVGFMLNKEKATDDSWIYFPEDKHIFVRVSEPSKYGSEMCPPGKTSIIAEITCSRGDKKWQLSDEKLIDLVKEQLISLNFLSNEEIIEQFAERITHAYPLFTIDYEKNLSLVLSFLSQIKNIELIGRTGTFQYLNMDLVLLHGLICAKKIAGLSDSTFTEVGHDNRWVG